MPIPAHLHLNLLPSVQGQGVGSMLLRAWLGLASTRGATAVHAGVNRANLRALRFLASKWLQGLETGRACRVPNCLDGPIMTVAARDACHR